MPEVTRKPTNLFEDFKLFWIEHVLSFICVIVWACVTYLMPVPNCPTGYLGAGGISEDGAYANCIGGAAGYIDWSLN